MPDVTTTTKNPIVKWVKLEFQINVIFNISIERDFLILTKFSSL